MSVQIYLCLIYVIYFPIIIFIFIKIKDVSSLLLKNLFLDIFVQSSASGYCLAFAFFFANFSLVLLIKMLLIKKVCILNQHFQRKRMKFENKIALFGYFWTRISRKLLSCSKSAPCKTIFFQFGTKNVLFGYLQARI